jgi:hypothetical protein
MRAGAEGGGRSVVVAVSGWCVTRPEPSIGAENVGKRWTTRQGLSPRTPGRFSVNHMLFMIRRPFSRGALSRDRRNSRGPIEPLTLTGGWL